MNHKELAMGAGATKATGKETRSRSAGILRRMFVRILQHAQQGHLVLREQGRVIAEIGDPASSLRAEVNILNPRLYLRVLLGGDAAAGEAFVDGWWTSPDVTSVTRFFARNLDMMDDWGSRFSWMLRPMHWLRMAARRNSRQQAKRNILAHYDLGNGLYQAFLDPRMQYSSALYARPDEDLATAQENKLARLCEQLQLQPDDHLLEVGSGWGGLAIYAATHYGCRVTTTTISDAQFNHARTAIAGAGLSERITLLNRDYRLLEGEYDKIVSVEMIEAVGKAYLPGYFSKLDSLLRPNGLLMIQAITIADQRANIYGRSEDFIQRHIFPGGYLPSLAGMTEIMSQRTELVVRNILDMGVDYAKTLAHWQEAFLQAWKDLEAKGFDDRFRNLWQYYLSYCEGGFHERRISVVQLLASKAPHGIA